MSATLLHAKIPFVGLKRNVVSILFIFDIPLVLNLLSAVCLGFFLFFSLSMFLSRYWALSVCGAFNYKFILYVLSQWSTLCIDLVSLSGELFKGFLTLDGITLFATCKVRRIFTVRTEHAGMSDDGKAVGCWFQILKFYRLTQYATPNVFNKDTVPKYLPQKQASGLCSCEFVWNYVCVFGEIERQTVGCFSVAGWGLSGRFCSRLIWLSSDNSCTLLAAYCTPTLSTKKGVSVSSYFSVDQSVTFVVWCYIL